MCERECECPALGRSLAPGLGLTIAARGCGLRVTPSLSKTSRQPDDIGGIQPVHSRTPLPPVVGAQGATRVPGAAITGLLRIIIQPPSVVGLVAGGCPALLITTPPPPRPLSSLFPKIAAFRVCLSFSMSKHGGATPGQRRPPVHPRSPANTHAHTHTHIHKSP